MTRVEQPGVDTFLGLSDTPSSYSGAGGQDVSVNSGATALEFTGKGSTGITDLSSQCDGATFAFTIDEAYVSGTIIVMGTDFPKIYRPGTDFVETSSTVITLQSAEVPAPGTGATLLATYEKA